MSQTNKRKVEYSSDPKIWQQWLKELSDEEEERDPEESDSGEIDHLSESDHNTNSEQSADEDDDYEGESQNSFYLGKDGKTKWLKCLPKKNVKTRSENIITHLPGPKGTASK